MLRNLRLTMMTTSTVKMEISVFASSRETMRSMTAKTGLRMRVCDDVGTAAGMEGFFGEFRPGRQRWIVLL